MAQPEKERMPEIKNSEITLEILPENALTDQPIAFRRSVRKEPNAFILFDFTAHTEEADGICSVQSEILLFAFGSSRSK